jgi:hypothetical protein
MEADGCWHGRFRDRSSTALDSPVLEQESLRPANERTGYVQSHAPVISACQLLLSDFSHVPEESALWRRKHQAHVLSRSPDLTERHPTASVSFCPLSARSPSTSICRANINSYKPTALHPAAGLGCHGVLSCELERLICTIYCWSHYGYSVCPCWCNILATLGVVVCNDLWPTGPSLGAHR